MSSTVFKLGVIGMVVAFLLGGVALGLGFFLLGDEPSQTASSGQREATFGELTRGEPMVDAWKEEPTGEEEQAEVEEEAPPEPPEEAAPEPETEEPETESAPQSPLPSEPQDWPEPDGGEIAAANGTRDYGNLPSGSVLGLTIDSLGVRNAPVWGDDSPASLDRGVVHIPETSMPWSNTPERNTFLAAHRIGYPGTGSRLLFYNLNKIERGDRVVLSNDRGRKYTYEVSEIFTVNPTDSWVMGRVRERDMITLQTCTPIPTFEKRLIVRADRV